jgi:hypothetical protein
VVKARAAQLGINIQAVFRVAVAPLFANGNTSNVSYTGDLEGRESGVGDLRVVSSVSSSDRWAVDLLSSERIYAALVGVNDHVCEDAFKSCALEDEWREGGG